MYFSQRGQQGFTLIELLVVIAIIGLLSSVIMASLRTARMKARDSQRTRDVRQVVNAVELYANEFGHYPCSGNNSEFFNKLENEGYLTNKVEDPLGGGNEYEFHTYKNTVGGPCGQVVYIGTYPEDPLEEGDCPLGGEEIGSNHCHILYPHGLNCSSPFLEDESASDCQALRD